MDFQEISELDKKSLHKQHDKRHNKNLMMRHCMMQKLIVFISDVVNISFSVLDYDS